MKFLKGGEWSMYFFIVIFWFFIQLWYSPTAYFLSCVLLFLHVIKGNSSKNSPYNRINLFLCKFFSYCNIPIMYSHIACRDIKGFMFVPLRIRNIMEKWAILTNHFDLQARIYIKRMHKMQKQCMLYLLKTL